MTVDRLERAVELYRQTAASRSAIVLVVANVIPLIGVYLFGWSLLTVLALYWLENGIVGFWNVPKILLAGGATPTVLPPIPEGAIWAATRGDPVAASKLRASWDEARAAQQQALDPVDAAGAGPRSAGSPRLLAAGAGRVGLALFFAIHYGMFWLVHGLFVFVLPSFLEFGGGQLLPACGDVDPFGNPQGCFSPFGTIVWSSLVIAGIALFLSHGASFLLNYVGRGEYLTATPMGQMFAPYGRVVILHLTILFGAFIVAFMGAPIGALLMLIVLKTAFDLGLHLRERGRSRG